MSTGVVRKQLGLPFDGETLGATHHLVIGDVQIKGLDRKVGCVVGAFASDRDLSASLALAHLGRHEYSFVNSYVVAGLDLSH